MDILDLLSAAMEDVGPVWDIPAYVAIQFITQDDEAYEKFSKFYAENYPESTDAVGMPSIEETRALLPLMKKADPLLDHLV